MGSAEPVTAENITGRGVSPGLQALPDLSTSVRFPALENCLGLLLAMVSLRAVPSLQ